jgi:hypothetical protein
MTPEVLKTELDRAEEAELQSDEQLRQLVEHIGKACAPSPTVDASDCAKTVTAALALNDRLRDRTNKLRQAVERAECPNPGAAMMAKFKAASNPTNP